MMMLFAFIATANFAVSCFLIFSLSEERGRNAELADRNAVQAQALARYHRQDDLRSIYEAECG